MDQGSGPVPSEAGGMQEPFFQVGGQALKEVVLGRNVLRDHECKNAKNLAVRNPV